MTDNSAPIDKQKTKFIYLVLTRYFNLVTLIIVLAIFSAAGFFFILPKRQQILQEKMDILNEKSDQKEILAKIYEKTEKYLEDFKKIDDSEKEKISQMMVAVGEKNLETANLFAQFDSLIRSQGLILRSIKIDSPEGDAKKAAATPKKNTANPPDIGKIDISLEVLGVNYDSLKSLLSKLENSLLIIDVNNLQFTPEQNSVSLDISVYYLK